MFKLDEAMVNEQFGRRLDIMPSNVMSRSVNFPVIGWLPLLRLPGLALIRLLGHEEAEIGMKVIFTDQILAQRNKDVREIIISKMIDVIVDGIMVQHHSVRHPLIVGPLMFEYVEGPVFVGVEQGTIMMGVEVVALTLVKWNSLK